MNYMEKCLFLSIIFALDQSIKTAFAEKYDLSFYQSLEFGTFFLLLPPYSAIWFVALVIC